MPRSLRQLEILLDVLKRMAHDRQARSARTTPQTNPLDEEIRTGRATNRFTWSSCCCEPSSSRFRRSRESFPAREFPRRIERTDTGGVGSAWNGRQADVLRLLQDILTTPAGITIAGGRGHLMNLCVRYHISFLRFSLDSSSRQSKRMAQAPPPDVEQIQRDAKLLYSKILQAHRAQIEEGTVDDLTLQLQARNLDGLGSTVSIRPSSKRRKNQPHDRSRLKISRRTDEKPPRAGPSLSAKAVHTADGPAADAPRGWPRTSEARGMRKGQAPGNESNEPADRASEEIRQREQSRLLELAPSRAGTSYEGSVGETASSHPSKAAQCLGRKVSSRPTKIESVSTFRRLSTNERECF